MMEIKAPDSSLQFLHQRQNFRLKCFYCYWPDLLVSDYSVLVDDIGLRYAVDAKLDACPAFRITGADRVRVPELPQPLQSQVALVFIVEAVDGYDAGFGQLNQYWMLLPAGDTP